MEKHMLVNSQTYLIPAHPSERKIKMATWICEELGHVFEEKQDK